jgi:hypothetical protein
MARAPILAILAVLLVAPAARADLPLGPRSLHETRTTDRLARGVTYTKIVRGHPSERDGWTADVAVVTGRAAADDLVARLRAAGFDARRLKLPGRYLVRSGHFAQKAGADARVAAIRAAGLPVRGSVFTGEDGRPTSGPWVVHVLRIDPRRGDVAAALANDVVADREPLTRIAARHDALAAVNGGYFVIGDADGTPGDLAGSSVLGGRLVSEAVDGRTDLLLRGGRPSITRISDDQWVTSSDGARRVLDGDNRKPGLIRACGGTGGDLPTEQPLHDITCTDPSELILSTPILGAPTESGPGVEAVLDRHGAVTAVRDPRGGPVPPDGRVLTGTGDAADWLRAHAAPGRRLTVHTRLHGARLTRHVDLVNGGPRLLPRITAYREGFEHPDDPGFYYAFALRRNPRTIAGVTRDGRLLLVAVDGHAPGYSVGLSFTEEAALMRALGARDAVNLDGGGSTTMTIRGNLVTRPSDATGERPIGDALLVDAQR